jgi:hypothetical protein
MTGRKKIITFGAVLIPAVLTDLVFRASDTDALATASTWARLAPLPASARNLHVDVKGSMFTREFVVTFTAPPHDVRQWLKGSPGPSSATQEYRVRSPYTRSVPAAERSSRKCA